MNKQTSTVVEQYLQIIYSMQEARKPVKAVNLSKLTGSSPSTVHATLSRLQRDGLVLVNEKKYIHLTDQGIDRAVMLVRRRRLTEKLLCEKLGIPLQEASNHVAPLIHTLTPLIEEKLADYLGEPKTCPHGKPIPN